MICICIGSFVDWEKGPQVGRLGNRSFLASIKNTWTMREDLHEHDQACVERLEGLVNRTRG